MHAHKVGYTLEPFLKCFCVSEIVQIRLNTIPDG